MVSYWRTKVAKKGRKLLKGSAKILKGFSEVSQLSYQLDCKRVQLPVIGKVKEFKKHNRAAQTSAVPSALQQIVVSMCWSMSCCLPLSWMWEILESLHVTSETCEPMVKARLLIPERKGRDSVRTWSICERKATWESNDWRNSRWFVTCDHRQFRHSCRQALRTQFHTKRQTRIVARLCSAIIQRGFLWLTSQWRDRWFQELLVVLKDEKTITKHDPSSKVF